MRTGTESSQYRYYFKEISIYEFNRISLVVMISILDVSMPVAEMGRDESVCNKRCLLYRSDNVLIQYELCWQISARASCHDFENTHLLIGLQDWGLT